jgi:hypothetical protein
VLRFVDPRDPVAWSYQVLSLCLLVAAIAGRALIGSRPPDQRRAADALPAAAAWPILFLAAVLPYLPTLRVGFLSDDFGLASAVRQAAGPLDAMGSDAFRSFFRPLTLLLWWLGGHLWAGSAVGYHVVSVFLHAIDALLVYALALRIIGSRYGGLMAGLLFAVHPLHVEPVTWLAASSGLLCATFCLLSLLLLDTYTERGSRAQRSLVLIGSVACFLLALLSKESAVALPGVVFVWLLVRPNSVPRGRALLVTGAYAGTLTCYLAWRFWVLGGVGGYELPMGFWNTAFPSAPLLMGLEFLFPAHTILFGEHLGPWLWTALLVLMAGVALWLLAGLDRVPSGRLCLWISFVFIMAIPIWVFRWQPSPTLEGSRFAYLPTLGLAWLFGDICAGRGVQRRGSLAIPVGVVATLGVLTIWYAGPWREAGRLASSVVEAGISVVDDLSEQSEDGTLYVRNLPEFHRGVPVFANGYPQALQLATGSPVAVRVVSDRPRSGGVHPDVLAASKLGSGDCVIAWDPESREMQAVCRGSSPGEDSSRGDTP